MKAACRGRILEPSACLGKPRTRRPRGSGLPFQQASRFPIPPHICKTSDWLERSPFTQPATEAVPLNTLMPQLWQPPTCPRSFGKVSLCLPLAPPRQT